MHFSKIIAFTRDPSSRSARALAALSSSIDVRKVTLDPDDADDVARLRAALQGVDVVVNTVTALYATARGFNLLVDEAIDAGVRVYFPSEFGV